MKAFSILGSGLAILLSVCVISHTATAQETQSNRDPAQRDPSQRDPSQRDPSQIATLDPKTSSKTIRASKLIGMSIQNELGKNVGQVYDIVLDTQTGKANYLAVTYGGFLGFGNKLFAVPYEAFTSHQDPNDRDNTILVLKVTQQQLDGAEGFDESQWPDFGDTKFTSEIDRQYGVDRQTSRDRDRAGIVDARTGSDGTESKVDKQPARKD